MKQIKIMLIEDHGIVREGLKNLIELEENMTVIGEAATCAEALKIINEEIDLILLDIGLPDGDGLELRKQIEVKFPNIKFVALTTYDDPMFIKKAMEYRIDGFIPKYASFGEIKSAITMTMKDSTYLYPGLNTDALFNLSETGLTDTETNILELIARGETQKIIADELFISLSTLRRRIKGICTKLGVKTLEEALASAVKKGLIK